MKKSKENFRYKYLKSFNIENIKKCFNIDILKSNFKKLIEINNNILIDKKLVNKRIIQLLFMYKILIKILEET